MAMWKNKDVYCREGNSFANSVSTVLIHLHFAACCVASFLLAIIFIYFDSMNRCPWRAFSSLFLTRQVLFEEKSRSKVTTVYNRLCWVLLIHRQLLVYNSRLPHVPHSHWSETFTNETENYFANSIIRWRGSDRVCSNVHWTLNVSWAWLTQQLKSSHSGASDDLCFVSFCNRRDDATIEHISTTQILCW